MCWNGTGNGLGAVQRLAGLALFGKVFEVRQVLGPGAGRLVLAKAREADCRDRQVLDLGRFPFLVSSVEINAGDCSEDLDSDRGDAETHQAVRFQKQSWCEVGGSKAEESHSVAAD